MSVLQQVLFFLVIMALQWVVPQFLAFIVTFFSPAYIGESKQGVGTTEYLDVNKMKKISLFISSFAFTGLVATMFADFTPACVIGAVGGLYNLSSNNTIEKYFDE